MENSELKYWLFFSKIGTIGPINFKKLYQYFPDLSLAYRANHQELLSLGLSEKIVHDISSKKQEIDLEKLLTDLTKENIKVITIKDNGYPPLLKEIANPPAVLYYQGEIINQADPEETTIAIVGARKATAYGLKVAEKLARELAERNITVVSGLAIGIDTAAHKAVVFKNKRTIAVLGSGLDKSSFYPKENLILQEQIIKSGGVTISEFPPETLPLPQHFPQRNRIIAGLGLATLVIEAAQTSGSLITARDALEQNREVLAVPGNISSPLSQGPNNLIKLGAKAVTEIEDILEAINF